ncbi:transposase [Halalkalibacter sp. AB-rgal2]|uniref:transposase n=1 Tax=Halalkalibacter sp. AB-rgal2 TaxID=3242695 RepID=UPI00359E1465
MNFKIIKSVLIEQISEEASIYECEGCSGCPFRSSCTKVKEGTHRKRKLRVNGSEYKTLPTTKRIEELHVK